MVTSETPTPTPSLNYKDLILRAQQVGVARKNIAYILQLDLDYVVNIIEINGEATSTSPGKMPNSYFTDRLSEGYSVLEIAVELNCSRQAIYKLLRIRGISIDAYRQSR